MSSETISKHEFEVRDLEIQKVVVFSDRAEIKRLARVQLNAGTNEVHVKNLTSSLLPDSLRVDGRGKAQIHEVQEKSQPAVHEEKDSPKVAGLRKILREREHEMKELEERKEVLDKRIQALDKMISEVGSSVVNPPKEAGSSFALDENTLGSLEKFFEYYENTSADLRKKTRNVQEELETAVEKTNKARNDLAQAINESYSHGWSRSAIITLESPAETEAELDIIYQVYNASWRPSYDIRVDTGATPNLKISYYGKISQSTEENWEDVPLVLTTAQPCLGGHVPELGTLEASFWRPPPPPVAQPERMLARGFGGPQVMNKCIAPMAAAPMMDTVAVAEVRENTLSTEFQIARLASIPQGGSDHKVTIGIVDVIPQLVHETVPSKNTSVFLTASAVNNSVLAFLNGEASVYLNNAFVAKTNIKNVSPGERFSVSLGVDTAIKVEYKPAKKYHEQTGFINKSSTNVNEQLISVKNSRSEHPILITIKHHVPRSTDEKIKISLINPNATPYDATAAGHHEESPKEGARLNSNNNLEWTVRLPGGKTENLVIKWVVEHPKEEKIEYNETF
ncbi:unnamed protein product [Caenorhabditis auriculariae]|uniref:DUF4139 domain-containing protein n=1 Tax=Caenorhabditis auriculariae TaxID=2777116 RepID=A0A8S1HAI6_9PELO|nr:unnamed protein product [Caenorhabditis auriculariae]